MRETVESSEDSYFFGDTLKKAFNVIPSNWGGHVVPAAWILLDESD